MRKLLCLLLAMCLLLCGCIYVQPQERPDNTEETTQPVQTAEPVQTTAPAQTSAPTEPVEVVDQVVFAHCYTDSQESATLTAWGYDGSTVWSYTSAAYPIGQLDAVSDIGADHGMYYIVENGTILAFDFHTGELLWQNGDFGGSPANLNSCVFDGQGNLYICGFFGPDVFAVDPEGNTIAHVPELDSRYYWAYGISLRENWLTVMLDGGPSGDLPQGYTYNIYVNTQLLGSQIGQPLTLQSAISLVEELYNGMSADDGTYVVFEDECEEVNGRYQMSVRYQLSDAEADAILAQGGTPSANTLAAIVYVDPLTGFVIPQQ